MPESVAGHLELLLANDGLTNQKIGTGYPIPGNAWATALKKIGSWIVLGTVQDLPAQILVSETPAGLY